MIHSFLLIGQSNMAGRGILGSEPEIINESIMMQRNGRWQMMAEPLHNDRPAAGIGLASSFAASWQSDHARGQIGLIPCADGGTSLDDWQVGGLLFDHAVAQARLARRSGPLAGILWHQGESDCTQESAARYCEKFDVIVTALRKQLAQPDVPLIIGAIGDFLPDGIYGSYFKSYTLVNDALRTYAQLHRDCYFVSAEGLTANEDQIHFNARSLRKFGLRYYHAFKHRADVTHPLPDEEVVLQAIYDRPLSLKERRFVVENLFASGKIGLSDFQERMSLIAGQ